MCKQNDIDIAIITETWLSDECPNEAVILDGYSLHRKDRVDKKGGGVAIYLKNSLPCKRWFENENPGFETIWITVRPQKLPSNIGQLIVVAVYHPPDAKNHLMLRHLQVNLEILLQKFPDSGIIVLGDLNQLPVKAISQGFRLQQIVDQPTRCGNVLDKILTNMTDHYPNPSIIGALATSDHECVLMKPKYVHIAKKAKKIIRTRDVSFNAKLRVSNALRNINWQSLYKSDDTNRQYDYLMNTICGIIDDNMPIKTKYVNPNEKPWITQEFKSLLSQRQSARKSGEIRLYKHLRNKINQTRTKLRSQFYHNSVNNMCDDPRNWWRKVKRLIGLTTEDSALTALANEHAGGDEKKLADMINNHFVSVSDDLNPIQASDVMNHEVPADMIISVDTVEKQLSSLNVKKAAGPDGVPTWFWKEFAPLLASPVCAIFNSSLRSSVVPSQWSIANVTPIPKTMPPTDPKKHLRPISLTPVLSKCMENYPVNILQDSINDSDQFGSTKGCSTLDALLETLQPLYPNLDRNCYVRMVLIDVAKAFDHIDHSIVISKLQLKEIPEVVIDWYRSFLSNRVQRVKIQSHCSEWKHVKGGVPQGTLSGPVLFKYMIEDLQTRVKTIKYVDDTTLVEVVSKGEQSHMQEALSDVMSWCSKNNLSINADKTKELLIFFGEGKSDIPKLNVNGSEIERVPHAKLLGIVISDDLRWGNHVQGIYKKASKRLFYLRQLKRSGLARNELTQIYKSLVRPIVEYCSELWSTSLTSELVSLVESIQVRACRIILPNMEYERACEELKLATLEERRFDAITKLFLKMQDHNHRLHHLLPPRRSSYYSLRHSYEYEPPKCKTKRHKDSPIPWCLFNLQ